MLEGLGAELVDLGRRGAACHVGVDAKAGATQPIEELALAVDVQRVGIGDGIDKGGQVAARRNLGILLTQTASGSVARVGEGSRPSASASSFRRTKLPLGI